MRTAETEQGHHGREAQTSVGRVVKALMALTGTNQADLAEWLHMDASIVSKMLTGARKMTVDDLVPEVRERIELLDSSRWRLSGRRVAS